MELPNVIHPVTYEVRGVLFRVAAYGPISEEEAQAFVRMYLQKHKLRKKDRGSVITIVTVAGAQ